jgi:hypothetical protein
LINRKKIKTMWGPPVSLTVRIDAPRLCRAPSNSGGHRLVHAHGFTHRFHHCSRPPFPSPSATASSGFKRSTPPKSSSFLPLPLLPCPCSPRRSLLPPLHPSPMPSSAQVMLLSRSTVLKWRFYLEPAAVNSPRRHPTLCVVSTEGASSTAAISGHCPPSFSPPRGPHRCPNPQRPASRCRQPSVRTIAAIPLWPTRATVDSPL